MKREIARRLREAYDVMLFDKEGFIIASLDAEEIDNVARALDKQEDYEAQWTDDMNNPLEPLKLSSALNSELFKLKFRLENKPKDVSPLDYTIIYALKDCLERAIDKE